MTGESDIRISRNRYWEVLMDGLTLLLFDGSLFILVFGLFVYFLKKDQQAQ